MSWRIVAIFLVLAHFPELFLGLTPDSTVHASPATDLYSEAPCEIHPQSAYRDVQGNVWGIGDGNLWWFNATNLSWSLLPMPNGTTASEPWRVACVDPRKYVAVVGENALLVLHLPWQHWQFGDAEDTGVGYVDRNATWCVFGYLFAVDLLRDLYLLDPEEAHWTVRDHMPVVPYVNWSTPYGLVNTWVGYNNEFIILQKFGVYDYVMYTNASAIDWVLMGENNSTDLWPHLDQTTQGRSLTWKMGSDHLWLWKEDNGITELWSFGYSTGKWQRGDEAFEKKLPPLNTVLAGWEDGKRYCIIKRSSDCASQYTPSHAECWLEKELIAKDVPSHTSEPDVRITTVLPTSQPKPERAFTKSTHFANYTHTSQVISTPMPATDLPTKAIPVSYQTPMKPIVTKFSPETKWKYPEKEQGVVAVSPTRDSAWHQHTSVFGSVIFFGTSITIFGLFGLFWCIRKCVHFPKEALLLRDPPSVRYTAIPDSLCYDSRRPTPATYTVIPDSFA